MPRSKQNNPKKLRGAGKSLRAKLLRIGRRCAADVKKGVKSKDHASLLYDNQGLPRKAAQIIDTSAVLAILLDEPDAATFAGAIEKFENRRMSAASYLEAALMIDNRGDALA
jgi:hypothetical protein